MANKPLSRQFLLNRGFCCNNGCLNCPYKSTNMPCYGPDGPTPTTKKELFEQQKKTFIEYINNTAYLLENALVCLNKEVDNNTIKAKSINYVDKILSDDITRRLCKIMKESEKDNIISKLLLKSKYALQLGVWWADHQKLDLLNKQI
jgi:hypothetical protein